MTRSTKVLILTAPFGSGHLQVSSASNRRVYET